MHSPGIKLEDVTAPYRSSPDSTPLLPPVRLARSVRGLERERFKVDPELESLPAPRSKPKRIPRPPNAFILFRSDLLKNPNFAANGPPHQQTLSRLAGQIWNGLTPDERQHWHDKARERSEIHKRENPDYHFKPSPRTKKVKCRTAPDNSDELLRLLRESCIPSICRPPKAKEEPEVMKPTPQRLPVLPPDAFSSFSWDSHSTETQPKLGAKAEAEIAPVTSPSVSPLDTRGMGPYSWSSLSTSCSPLPPLTFAESVLNRPPLPSFFPQHTFPHYSAPPRRPSTSLGFVRRLEPTSYFEPGITIERPASAVGFVRDLELAATDIKSISVPSTPGVYPALDENFSFPFLASTGEVPAFPEESLPDFMDFDFVNPLDPCFTLGDWSQVGRPQ